MLQRPLLVAQAQVVIDQAQVDTCAFGRFEGGGWIDHGSGRVPVGRIEGGAHE